MTEHFLITRFNIRNEDWEKDKNCQKILDDTWLSKRISLFKEFCLPSVLHQSSKEFKWLIFFENKKDKQIDILIDLLKQYDFIEPIFINGYGHFLSSISQIVQQKLPIKAKLVLTSRLDNDDALHKDYIKTLQRKIILEHNAVVYFPYGLCLDLGRKKRLAQQFHPLNQFITLVEDKRQMEGNLKTVFINPHNKWGEEYIIQPVRKDNLWLQVTHSGNMINEFGGTPAFSKKLKGFAIEKPNFSAMYDVKVAMHRLKRSPIRLKKFFKK